MKQLAPLNRLSLFFFTLFLASSVSAQTGYTEDFNDGLSDWWGGDHYSLSIINNVLQVDVHKTARWANFGHDMQDTLDFSSSPYINIQLKGEKGFLLTAYLVDVTGENITVTNTIMPSDTLTNVFFDFTGITKTDFALDSIQKFYFVVGAHFPADNIIWLENLKAGSDASKLANIGGINDKVYYQNSGKHQIDVTQLDNVSSLSYTGGGSLVQDISFSSISSSEDGFSTMTLTLNDGVTGSETITIDATGDGTFADNQTSFDLEVANNQPPEMDPVQDVVLRTGVAREFVITGITDGDATKEQDLTFHAVSNNSTVLQDADINIIYENGSKRASVSLLANGTGTSNITISLVDDSGEANDSIAKSFTVNVFDNPNFAPEIDKIPDQVTTNVEIPRFIQVTGISDGNDFTQALSFNLNSSNNTAIHTDSLSIDYTPGETTAMLRYVPADIGDATITVTLSDDGTGTDNGLKQVQKTFNIQVINQYPTGAVIDLSNTVGWGPNPSITLTPVDSVSFDAMKIDASNKGIWDGINLNLPTPLDLTEHPYLSMDVYCADDSLLQWFYFIEQLSPLIRNNYPKSSTPEEDGGKAKWASSGKWVHLAFDFSGENEMSREVDGEPVPINSAEITAILLNYHNAKSNWPFPPKYNGTFYMRNLRIGSEADFGNPPTTIDPVANQIHFLNSGMQQVNLTGITDGYKNSTALPDITVSSSNPTFVDPVMSAVQTDGTATLEYSTNDTGSSDITLTISGDSSKTTTFTFNISALDTSVSSAITLNIDTTVKYQTIRGIGAHEPGLSSLDYFTNDLEASAIRLSLISNRLEPVNDNDDPHVLNRDALNYDVFDFDKLRKYKNAGINTFIVTFWSPPAWTKENFALEMIAGSSGSPYANTYNKLAMFNYDEFTETHVAMAKVFEEEVGIPLTGISPQIEPRWSQPFASCQYNPEDYAIIVDSVGQRFNKEKINTIVFMPGDVIVQNFTQYLDGVQNNPSADTLTDAFAIHSIISGYSGFEKWTTLWTEAQEGSHPKEVWQTSGGPKAQTWDKAMKNIGGGLYGEFKFGHSSLSSFFVFENSFLDNGIPNQQYHVFKHYTKHIRPGAVMIDCDDSNHADLLATAFMNNEKNQKRQVVVMINKGTAPITVKLDGTGLSEYFEVYNSHEFSYYNSLGILKSDSVIILPGNSITTLAEKIINKAPTIIQVDEQTIEINSGQQTVNLKGITDGNPNQTQNISIVSVTSSNQDLIPNANLSVNYSDGTTGIIQYESLTDSIGETIITVKLKDDGGLEFGGIDSAIMSFKISVLVDINQKPEINIPDDIIINEDAGEQTIQLTGITDGDNGNIDQGVTISASSNNTALVPTPAVTDVQTGGTAILSFTPAKDANGSAIITLTISDNGGTPENQGDESIMVDFNVTVQAVNDAPVYENVNYDSTVNVGDEDSISITGIMDGDPEVDQNMNIQVVPLDDNLVNNINTSYTGKENATISYTAINKGVVRFNITLSDDGGTANGGTDTVTFDVRITIIDGVNVVNKNKQSLKVYPNPANDILNIDIPNHASTNLISVVDMMGRVRIAEENTTLPVALDISSLSQGIYIVKVINGSTSYNRIFTVK